MHLFPPRTNQVVQGEWGSNGSEQTLRPPLLCLSGDPYEDQVTYLYTCRRPRCSYSILPGCWQSVCEPPWTQGSWFCRSCYTVLEASNLDTSTNPHPSTRFPELHLISGCGSLHLPSSVAEWNIKRISICKHSSVSLTVSGFTYLTWDGIQVWVVIGWVFPSFCCIFIIGSYRQDKFGLKVCV